MNGAVLEAPALARALSGLRGRIDETLVHARRVGAALRARLRGDGCARGAAAGHIGAALAADGLPRTTRAGASPGNARNTQTGTNTCTDAHANHMHVCMVHARIHTAESSKFTRKIRLGQSMVSMRRCNITRRETGVQ